VSLFFPPSLFFEEDFFLEGADFEEEELSSFALFLRSSVDLALAVGRNEGHMIKIMC
jgi:hypothetical protein